MSFDRLAPHYNWLEALTAGSKLDQARAFWLGALEGHKRVLSVGEGHGKFAQAFATRFPFTTLTCVESSAPMVQHAKRRLQGIRATIDWVHSDFLQWEPKEKYDAIVTCFFLDCFPGEVLEDVVARLASSAEPDAVWLIVDFAVPARGIARWRARAVHLLMYWFFRLFTDLPARQQTEPDPFLKAQGFVLERRQDFEWGLIRADVWIRNAGGKSG